MDAIVDRRERVPQLVAEHRQKLVLAAIGDSQLLHSQRCLAHRVRRVTSDGAVDHSGVTGGTDVAHVLSVAPRSRHLCDGWQALEDTSGLGIDNEKAVLCEWQAGKAWFGSKHRRARVRFG